ncbi:MAG: PDZ domain-containing protein, partial [Oscillospiraceae bacterium]|nr:PDZ domain-containing protein [Oscillospiraceae bacterium]
AVPIAEDLIAHGYVSSRTRVGITYMSIGDAAANGYGIPAGLCVMEIDQRSGAIYAGLKPYDVITHIDGQRVFGASEIADVLADKVPGDVITISVFRKEVTGETKIFEAELELTADTSSVSGYGVSDEKEDFFGRDIIK